MSEAGRGVRFSPMGILGAVLVVLVATVCVRLGFWQLDRLEQRRAFNTSAAAGLELPPLALDSSALATLEQEPDLYVFRRAVARGSYVGDGELLLRGRSESGQPGVHLVAPFRIAESGEVILVNRGWVPSPDGATADPRPFRRQGVVEVEGILQLLPDAGTEAAPLPVQVGDTTILTLRRLDRGLLSASYNFHLPPLYLQLVPGGGAAAPPVAVPLPSFGEGPHLGYAVQWFSFATIAVLGFLIAVFLKARSPNKPSTRPEFPPPKP